MLSTIGVGILNVFATVLALLIMDKFDRKKMLTVGSVGIAISLVLLSFSSSFHFSTSAILRHVTLCCLCIYIFFLPLAGDIQCG
ncbi:MFS transporter [Candidatus Endomicrobiellum pyrsonymphae]|uniref:MFS transporter n=1 Tax=Candidatus Endomicrobiellum pyrsonymphae TaxID=1408203 RepID=UPI0035A89B67